MSRRLLALLALCACLAGCKKAPAPSGKRYAIRVEASVPARVRVTPGEGWKLNLEYENSLEVRSSTGPPVTLGHKDGRVTEQELVYSVPARPGQSYQGHVSFAICNPRACIPIREAVSWTTPP